MGNEWCEQGGACGLLARDLDVRKSYPDGIYWLTVGRDPRFEQRQAQLVRMLTGRNEPITISEQGRTLLGEVLRGRACLLILCDVWTVRDMKALDAIDEAGMVLITTRNSGIGRDLGDAKYSLDQLRPEAAQDLLARTSGTDRFLIPG